MKFKTAFTLFVTLMRTIDRRVDGAVATTVAAEELPPQPTRKTKTVKKDGSTSSTSSTSTTDATSLVVIPSCTGFHADPYRFGGDPVPCCYPLEKKLKDWDVDGTYRYQCEEPSDDCCTTGIGCTDDSNCCDQFGDRFECLLEDGCCVGACTYPVGRQSCWPWVVPPPKESDCCTTGIGCTENDDCCLAGVFGDPFSCTLDNPSGCCVGDCTYPVGRQSCYPWVLPRTNTCYPALTPFSGTSVTTKKGLKLPFQTCYKYRNDGNVCYTQSWTDGAGYYYQCLPKDPYGTFTYNVPWCGTPCKDLAPATKQCLEKWGGDKDDQQCSVSEDCCGDFVCMEFTPAWPWSIFSKQYFCSIDCIECGDGKMCCYYDWSWPNGSESRFSFECCPGG